MNFFRAAAVLALLVAFGAGCSLAYTYYQDRVELKFARQALACMQCTTAKKAAEAKWQQVQSQVQLLRSRGKHHQAEVIERAHAGERPVNVESPCEACYLSGPDYKTSEWIVMVSVIASLALFGAAHKLPTTAAANRELG